MGERFLHTVEVEKVRGEWTDPAAGRIKFAEWAFQVETTRPNRRESMRSRDASCLRTLILPRFGEVEVGAIRPTDIRAWVAQLENNGYAPATIAKAYQILPRALRVASPTG